MRPAKKAPRQTGAIIHVKETDHGDSIRLWWHQCNGGNPFGNLVMALSLRFRSRDAIFWLPSARAFVWRVTSEDNVLSTDAIAAARPAAPAVPMTGSIEDVASDTLLARILGSLDDDKAEDVVAIDLRGRSDVADHMVICSGRSSRQVGAIAEKLMDRLKREFGIFCKVEGKEQGDWVLIDAGDVIVHVFRPEVREFYQLEKMWMPTTSGKSATTV